MGFRCLEGEERGGREGRGRDGKGGREGGDGFLTFWMVNGRPTSGDEVERSDRTATCALDRLVLFAV